MSALVDSLLKICKDIPNDPESDIYKELETAQEEYFVDMWIYEQEVKFENQILDYSNNTDLRTLLGLMENKT